MAWTDFVTRYKWSIGNDNDVVQELNLVNIQIIIYFVNLRNQTFHRTCFYYSFPLTCILKCRNAPVLIILRVLNDFYNHIKSDIYFYLRYFNEISCIVLYLISYDKIKTYIIKDYRAPQDKAPPLWYHNYMTMFIKGM